MSRSRHVQIHNHSSVLSSTFHEVFTLRRFSFYSHFLRHHVTSLCLVSTIDNEGTCANVLCFLSQIKAFEKMDHLARAQRILELQEAENARVSDAVLLTSGWERCHCPDPYTDLCSYVQFKSKIHRICLQNKLEEEKAVMKLVDSWGPCRVRMIF